MSVFSTIDIPRVHDTYKLKTPVQLHLE